MEGQGEIMSSVWAQWARGVCRWRCPGMNWVLGLWFGRQAGAAERNPRAISAGTAAEATGVEIFIASRMNSTYRRGLICLLFVFRGKHLVPEANLISNENDF